VHPILEQLAAETDAIEFVKLDIDQNPVTASRYGVLSIPTAILFEGGEPRETVIGARPRSHFEQAWAAWLT
jgi:thioredoxin 1